MITGELGRGDDRYRLKGEDGLIKCHMLKFCMARPRKEVKATEKGMCALHMCV